MNERTRLQLRLQATVEGLSVAAISYYVVGLFGYLVKGAHDEGVPVDTAFATALFVPVAVLAIWWVVRRVRRKTSRRGIIERGKAMRTERFDFPNAKGEQLAALLDLPPASRAPTRCSRTASPAARTCWRPSASPRG